MSPSTFRAAFPRPGWREPVAVPEAIASAGNTAVDAEREPRRWQRRADESVIPWFYRTLRNAAIDQFRRRGAADRAYQAFARELETHEAPTGEIEAEICACVSRLVATLKPEYAEALQAIEVSGITVKAFAQQKGLSSSNAAVRVFRARESLSSADDEAEQVGSGGSGVSSRQDTVLDCRASAVADYTGTFGHQLRVRASTDGRK